MYVYFHSSSIERFKSKQFWEVVMKFIVCPSCGEEVVIKDLYEGVEIQC